MLVGASLQDEIGDALVADGCNLVMMYGALVFLFSRKSYKLTALTLRTEIGIISVTLLKPDDKSPNDWQYFRVNFFVLQCRAHLSRQPSDCTTHRSSSRLEIRFGLSSFHPGKHGYLYIVR